MKHSKICMALLSTVGRVMSGTLLAALLAGCGGGGATSLQWQQVGEQTTCEAANPAICSGRYGFTVDNQGNFVVGPNPQAKTVKGALTTAEFNQLKSLLNVMTADINGNPNQVCQAMATTPGYSDVIGISMVTGQNFVVQDVLHGKCAYGGHVADTTALIDDMDQLRAKYYPSPF
jgi:hypothetical protein